MLNDSTDAFCNLESIHARRRGLRQALMYAFYLNRSKHVAYSHVPEDQRQYGMFNGCNLSFVIVDGKTERNAGESEPTFIM
jgi:hypothetical protein